MSFSIEIDNGSRTAIDHVESEVQRSFNRHVTATATTTRPEANSVTLDEGDTEVFIVENTTDQFGGLLKDVQYRGGRVDLEVESFERHAKNAKPTDAKLSFSNAADSTIVSDALSGVNELSAGTVDTVVTGIDTLYYHATRALQIRRMRELSRAEVRYNADKTVDYRTEGTFGADKTATTISPSNQNLTRSRVRKRAGRDVATHLRVIGGGGVSVNVAADSYSSGEKVWGRASFQEVTTEATLTTLGKKLLEDLNTQWKEVSATITDQNVALGDKFTVDHPEQNISNEVLRVVKVVVKRAKDGAKRFQTTLSNRPLARARQLVQTERRASQATRTGQSTGSPNKPNAHLPFVKLPPDDSISMTVGVQSGSRLYLWQSDIRGLGSASAPQFPDVKAQLVSGVPSSETVEFESAEFERGAPLATVDGSQAVDFRVDNPTSSTVEVAATWSYTVEPTAGV